MTCHRDRTYRLTRVLFHATARRQRRWNEYQGAYWHIETARILYAQAADTAEAIRAEYIRWTA